MSGEVNGAWMAARSLLYVPGDDADKLAKALDRGADALIVDLEDAVAPSRKESARERVLAWLAELHDPPAPIWVRINDGDRRIDDLEALRHAPNLYGLCLAKTRSADEAADIARRLAGTGLRLMALLETASALLEAPAIAAVERVERLQLGEVDLCADLGLQPGPDGIELLWARSRVVAASAAAGIDPPAGAVSTDFRDLSGLAASTRSLRRLGFFGRACIHPAQIPTVHEAFRPTPDEVERARRLVSLLDSDTGVGVGVGVDENGRMVDEAVIRSARRVLATASRY